MPPKDSILISCYFKRLHNHYIFPHIPWALWFAYTRKFGIVPTWVQLKLVFLTYYFIDYLYYGTYTMYTLQMSFASDIAFLFNSENERINGFRCFLLHKKPCIKALVICGETWLRALDGLWMCFLYHLKIGIEYARVLSPTYFQIRIGYW